MPVQFTYGCHTCNECGDRVYVPRIFEPAVESNDELAIKCNHCLNAESVQREAETEGGAQ